MASILLTIGEPILSDVISRLVDKATTSDFLHFVRKENLEVEIKKWRKTLTNLNAVLADAEKKKTTSEASNSVKEWLTDLRAIVYDVEDVFDELNYEALHRNFIAEPEASSCSSKMQALIPSCCSSFSLSNVKFGSKLKDITTRLEEIVKQKNDLALLQEKLKERLSLKKFLIVVDDVWNENVDDWETLCLPFITGVPGCKILVTTRNKFVMTTMNVTPHHLEQLSVKDCVLIMQDYALGEMDVGEAYNKAENIFHLSFVSSRYDILKRFKNISELKKLRTFLALYRRIEEILFGERMLSYDILHTILPELKFLKVLSLYRYAISELPNNIDLLKLLRYLDLSWSHITRLPHSVAALHNLQTLILYQCSYLVELPRNIINLTELHKLDLADTKNLLEMPSGIRSLTKLQTLSKFIVSKGDKHQIRELQGLTRLRGKLSIYGLDNVQDIKDVRSANLKGKERLDNIALIWSNEFYDSRNAELEMQVLDLLEPNKNLKVIKIESYGGNEFSSWLGNPCFANLERVTLLRCKKCKSLPSLGRLPLLKYMFIEENDGVERVGPEFFSGSKSFPMLDTLEFDNMDFLARLKNVQAWEKQS
ncbi:hypothetical protein ACFE04_010487 [Oxalis oulophora]